MGWLTSFRWRIWKRTVLVREMLQTVELALRCPESGAEDADCDGPGRAAGAGGQRYHAVLHDRRAGRWRLPANVSLTSANSNGTHNAVARRYTAGESPWTRGGSAD